MTAHVTAGPWHHRIKVEDVPETGLHLDLQPDEETRAALVRLAGVVSLSAVRASFDISRHGRGGLHVSGEVTATVVQTCVVSLAPMETELSEPVDLLFLPEAPAAAEEDAEEPEILHEGATDLGLLATEFLVLAIDPYPRKPGAVFAAPTEADTGAHPFAALAALKKDRGDR